MRDTKTDNRLHGPNAGGDYNRLEIRNFAAIELGSLLEIEVEVKPNRTAAEWDALRDKVRDALKRELETTK